jgi:hypothetical protein
MRFLVSSLAILMFLVTTVINSSHVHGHESVEAECLVSHLSNAVDSFDIPYNTTTVKEIVIIQSLLNSVCVDQRIYLLLRYSAFTPRGPPTA